MSRVLFITAVRQAQAEERYRRLVAGEIVPRDAELTEAGCRASLALLPPAFRENTRVWSVAERFSPDGRIVVARDITDTTAVVLPFAQRGAGHRADATPKGAA